MYCNKRHTYEMLRIHITSIGLKRQKQKPSKKKNDKKLIHRNFNTCPCKGYTRYHFFVGTLINFLFFWA